MTLAGEDRGECVVGHTIAGKFQRPITHFRASREFGDGVDLHLDVEVAHSATAPDHSDHSEIVLAAIKHDLVDKTPQQRLALSIRGGWILPNVWEMPGKVDDFAKHDLTNPHLTDGLCRGLLSQRLFGRSDLAQGDFPASFEFRSDETIVGVDFVELAFGQRGGIALALKLPFGTGSQRRIALLLGPPR